MKKYQASRSRTGLSIGASSILVIFVLLCLVAFAVLSLVSARADKALSDKNIQHLTAYYEAETAAYEKLFALDTLLVQNTDGKTSDDDAYFDRCETALADAGFSVSRSTAGLMVDYAIPVTQTQNLAVRIRVRPFAERGFSDAASAEKPGCYSIESWAVTGEGDWQPSEELPVYHKNAALPTL